MTKLKPLSAFKKFRMNAIFFVARVLNVPIDVQGQYFPRYPCKPSVKASS